MPASPGTTIPLTTPPLSITERNTLNSVSFTRSVTSVKPYQNEDPAYQAVFIHCFVPCNYEGIGKEISLPNAVLNT